MSDLLDITRTAAASPSRRARARPPPAATARATSRSPGATARSRRSPRRPRAASASTSTSTAATPRSRRATCARTRSTASSRTRSRSRARSRPTRTGACPTRSSTAARPSVDLELEDPSHGALDAAERRRRSPRRSRPRRAPCPGAERDPLGHDRASPTRAPRARSSTRTASRATKRGTDFWISAEVTVKDPDGRRPEEYAASGGRFRAAMEPPEVVGRRAAERAPRAHRLARRASRRCMTMVVDDRASGRLVGRAARPARRRVDPAEALASSRGSSAPRSASPLLDLARRSARAARPRLAPLRRRGDRGAAVPGLRAGRPPELLRRHLLRPEARDGADDRAHLEPRLDARRAVAARSSSRELGEGVLVTGFLGGNSNGTTGDFSLGVRGFRVRGGRLAEPVGEMNVSGNHLELWRRLVAVGNDPTRTPSMRTPTLVFEGVQFAGT